MFQEITIVIRVDSILDSLLLLVQLDFSGTKHLLFLRNKEAADDSNFP
jgi:hypothetical protein